MALTRITKGVIKPNENYDTHNIVSTGIVTSVGLDVNGNADISGNFSVGGVLTYEDVTSIDSVGIITAQKDIHVGAGFSAVGVGTFGSLDIGGDIDVDGHTNLDNISVAGVSTFSSDVYLLDNDHLRVGGTAGSQDGLDIYHSGSHSYINDIGTGRLIIQSSQLCLQDNSGNNHIINNPGADVQLYYDFNNHSTPKLKTTATGVTIDGTAVAGGLDISGDIDVDGHTNLDNVNVSGTSTVTGVLYPQNGFRVPDDVYSYFGTGNDLSIRVDEASGTDHSYIFHNGNGVFKLASNTQLILGETGPRNYIEMNKDSDVKLFFNNNQKLATSNTGITITGTAVATGADINGDLDVDGHTNLDNVSISGVVTATSFAPTAVTAQLSHRNILHNGEFKVIQRYGTSFTINSDADNEFTFDRWYVGTHNNLGNFTVSQEADAPAGFRTSAKIQCTSTDTSSSGSEQSFIQQTVEAQNVSHIFNGSSSQPMTLSFYYKSNATTTRQLWFYTPDQTRHYSAIFTPSATNTWEKITIPIPADTSNTVNDDNGAGFYVRFMIGTGTVYKSGRPTSWSALSNDRYSGVTNLTTNTANNFYITGVQLEMGSVSTPYEHRTMSEELVNCQRYYYPYKSILKGASDGVGRPWVPVQMFLNDSSANDVFVVIAGLNEQRAKMRTGSAEVRVLAPLNSAPQTTYPSAGQWAYFYRGQGSGFKSGGGAFTWNDGYYNMYGCRSIATPRPTQIMIETNSEVGKVYVELDDEI